MDEFIDNLEIKEKHIPIIIELLKLPYSKFIDIMNLLKINKYKLDNFVASNLSTYRNNRSFNSDDENINLNKYIDNNYLDILFTSAINKYDGVPVEEMLIYDYDTKSNIYQSILNELYKESNINQYIYERIDLKSLRFSNNTLTDTDMKSRKSNFNILKQKQTEMFNNIGKDE